MPRSVAAKVLSGFWFSFVTLAIITYTASLINHLLWASTKQGDPTKTPFLDLAHLVTAHAQLGYDYGVAVTGPSFRFLAQEAAGHEYDMMRKYWMTEGQQSLVLDTSHGILRARQGKFVFITERMTAEFFLNQRPCDLIMINKPIALQSYGMALSQRVDRSVKKAMQVALAEMAETGQMDILEQHWFQDTSECWNETRKETAKSAASALYMETPKQVTMSMFWGPVTILFIGVVLSLFLFIAEVLHYGYKGQYSRQNRDGGHRLGSREGELAG